MKLNISRRSMSQMKSLDILTYHDKGQFSFREIGEMLGISAQAAHKRYKKAKELTKG